MNDRLQWMYTALRMLVGMPIAAVGYGFVLSNRELLGLLLVIGGLVIAIRQSFGFALAAIYFAVMIPGMLWLFWKIYEFTNKEEIAFFDWAALELKKLPFLALVALIWWWWNSGDPFKDREL